MILNQTLSETSFRKRQIVKEYLIQLEHHIDDLRNGTAENTFEVKEFADQLHIHPTHLSNTVHEVLNQSPCDLYEQKLLALAKELLNNTHLSIAEIARHLFFDPSNFTKFFKRFEGTTPKQFRQVYVKNLK